MLKQSIYNRVVFLCNCVYKKLAYPYNYNMVYSVDKHSGLRLEYFKQKDVNIIVFCGTNQLKDWISNFKMALGIRPIQFKQALKICKELAYEDDKPLVICGHSLGGGIAQYVGNKIEKENVIVVTFNGAGIKHISKPKYEFGIYNFVTHRDILNRITSKLPFNYFKHNGDVIYVKDIKKQNGIKSHSDFKSFMKHKVE